MGPALDAQSIMVSDPWPPDSLTGLVAKAEAQHKGAYADVPGALAPTGHVGLPLMMQMGGMENPISPFVVPGSRGMAMRRHSQQGYRRGSLASPPPASRRSGGSSCKICRRCIWQQGLPCWRRVSCGETVLG